jgi:hypothetical protein
MRDVQIHVRTHLWTWNSKKSFVEFVGRNKAPAVQLYMAGWSPQQKEDVVETLWELLDKEFPDKDRFSVPMVANIVVGRKQTKN